MKSRFFKLLLIQLVIWLIYQIIDGLFWYYNQTDSLGYIVKDKFFRIIIPCFATSLLIILLHFLSRKYATTKYLKIPILFISIIVSFIAYFYIVSFYFRYIWILEQHSMSIGHFIFASNYYWLLFVFLNVANYAYDIWTEFKKQKLKISDLLTVKQENKNEAYQYNSKLFVSDKINENNIHINSIKFIQADTYISNIIVINNKRITLNRSLKKWEEKLPKENFLRIHKSYIVNLDYIEKINKLPNQTYEVFIKDYISPIQMSRRIGKELCLKFKN